MERLLRPAWVEVNLDALDRNIKNIRRKAGGAQLIGVIKADAYGHGAVECARVLRQNGCRMFAVATLEEAAHLRAGGAGEEIIVLGLVPDENADDAARLDVIPAVCSYANAAAFSAAAQRCGVLMQILVAVDTGMGRIGYLPEEAEQAAEEIRRMQQLPNIKVAGIFSHMSTADCADKMFSRLQEARFNAFTAKLDACGVHLPMRTLANSASIMELPSVLFEAVRPGIILYGLYPSGEVDPAQLELEPVMAVKAKIVHLKDVPAGFSVGYGRRYISQRPSRIATIPVGYADGLPRPYSPQAKILVRGHAAPVAGNICMDQFMADVTDVPGVQEGDEVIIMGSDGVHAITADDIAAATGTINYEVVCAFGQRLPKVYKGLCAGR